jgi:hypothetical protein
LTVSDTLNTGCDRFGGAVDLGTCQQALLHYSAPGYDFYTVQAPSDPRLPSGGGYRVLGLNDVSPTAPASQPIAQTYFNALNYTWNGLDTQFNWRAPKGIRVQGGTSTAQTKRDRCGAVLDFTMNAFGFGDTPSIRGREGAELGACNQLSPWQTTLRANASYTVPWADVLVSAVFQSFPGTDISANLTYTKDQVQWNAGSASRATRACANPAQGAGCFTSVITPTTVVVNLLNTNELFGERVSYWDMKFAKNIRFSGKRAQVGVDHYTIFNSDAITSYNSTFVIDNPTTPTNENTWLQPLSLISPRYVRFQVQFDF